MTDEGQPDPGLVHVEANSKRPNAVVLDRRTVSLTVFALLVLIGASVVYGLRASNRAEAAAAQSVQNERIIEAVQEQSDRNGALIEQGVDCLVALQQQEALEADTERQVFADAAGIVLPEVADRVSIPTDVQRRFIEEACTRFFTFQEADDAVAPPPAEP